MRTVAFVVAAAGLALAAACSVSAATGTTCVPAGACEGAQVCTSQEVGGACKSVSYETSAGTFQCASCSDCTQAAAQAATACGAGSSSGGSDGGGMSSCSSTTLCADGSLMSVCDALDANGACTSITYTVDSQHFTCAGCMDCESVQAAAANACGNAGGGSGGSSGSSGSSSGSTYDGTTGESCTTDADCEPAGGPGVNKCTNDVLFTTGALYPSPVCFLPAECDPGVDGQIHFCDGPDAASSPGVCLPTTSPAQTGMGICLPQCNFKPDGSAVTGCQGKDQCNLYGIGSDASGDPLGIGYCYNGCDSDADCTAAGANQHCQVDEGICVTTVVADAAQGTACDSTTGTPTCDCISNTTTGLGYCGQFCKVGGTECSAGWICDPQLPTSLVSSADATVAGWTKDNPGMAGFCAPTCAGDGSTCLTNSTCQSGDVGGPDCLP